MGWPFFFGVNPIESAAIVLLDKIILLVTSDGSRLLATCRCTLQQSYIFMMHFRESSFAATPIQLSRSTLTMGTTNSHSSMQQ